MAGTVHERLISVGDRRGGINKAAGEGRYARSRPGRRSRLVVMSSKDAVDMSARDDIVLRIGELIRGLRRLFRSICTRPA